MKRMRSRFLMWGGALALLLVGACGDDEGSSGGDDDGGGGSGVGAGGVGAGLPSGGFCNDYCDQLEQDGCAISSCNEDGDPNGIPTTCPSSLAAYERLGCDEAWISSVNCIEQECDTLCCTEADVCLDEAGEFLECLVNGCDAMPDEPLCVSQ